MGFILFKRIPTLAVINRVEIIQRFGKRY